MVAATLHPLGPPPGRPTPLGAFLFTLALTAALLIVFLLWAARAITAPLARFAAAAQDFALDRDPSPLPEETGPYEVRTASKALNQLQSRVRALVDNRTRMLAAMSHDLRTPITRMRLRVEFIDQNETRELMLRDLDQMDRMVRAALSYLRQGPSADRRELIDIASLLQTICNDFFDLGGDVVYNGPNHLLVRCNIDEIRRAATNLIENSLKYAGTRVIVEVTDDGGYDDRHRRDRLRRRNSKRHQGCDAGALRPRRRRRQRARVRVDLDLAWQSRSRRPKPMAASCAFSIHCRPAWWRGSSCRSSRT